MSEQLQAQLDQVNNVLKTVTAQSQCNQKMLNEALQREAQLNNHLFLMNTDLQNKVQEVKVLTKQLADANAKLNPPKEEPKPE